MPIPTLAINAIEIKVAMYCIKRSIFDAYNANTNREFDARIAPGYWVTRYQGQPEMMIIDDPSEFPESAAGLNMGGRVPTDITAWAYRNLTYEAVVAHLLNGITLTPIPDGTGDNAYWKYAAALSETQSDTVVVPIQGTQIRPTKLLIWHRISYTVQGQVGLYTVVGSKEVCLAGIYDYPINSALTFACVQTSQGGMYTDHDGLNAVANPMLSPTVAMVRGFAAIRGTNITDILPYFNPNTAPFIKVGVRCHSGTNTTTYIHDVASYQRSSIVQEPTYALMVGTTVFSLSNTAFINNYAKYYPHTFYWATILLQDPLTTDSFNLPRSIYDSTGALKLVDGYTPCICLKDLRSINAEGQNVWTDPENATVPLCAKITAAYVDPQITLQKKAIILYQNLGYLFPKAMPVLINNPAGATTITIAANDYAVNIPGSSTCRIYSPLSQTWEELPITSGAILHTGTTYPAVTVEPGRVRQLNIPLSLQYATPEILGLTIPAGLQGQPIRMPIVTTVDYTQGGITYSLQMPGFLYLLSTPTLQNLGVTVNPSNPTQASGWKFELKTRVYSGSDFGATDFAANNPGYNRKTLSVLAPQTSGFTLYDHEFLEAGSLSGNGMWLIEKYDLTTGQTFNVQAGNNTITVLVPEDLPSPQSIQIPMTFFNYLAGATGATDISFPFNMDDSVSSTSRITIPNPN